MVQVQELGVQKISLSELSEEQNYEIDASLRIFVIKSSLPHHVSEPILKLSGKFWDSSSHLKNVHRI